MVSSPIIGFKPQTLRWKCGCCWNWGGAGTHVTSVLSLFSDGPWMAKWINFIQFYLISQLFWLANVSSFSWPKYVLLPIQEPASPASPASPDSPEAVPAVEEKASGHPWRFDQRSSKRATNNWITDLTDKPRVITNDYHIIKIEVGDASWNIVRISGISATVPYATYYPKQWN